MVGSSDSGVALPGVEVGVWWRRHAVWFIDHTPGTNGGTFGRA